MANASLINLALLWTAVAGSASGMVYVTTTFAASEDVHRIEVRLIKRDLRELRHDLVEATDPAHIEDIEEEIEELIDDLCMVAPDDRECKQ